MKQYGASPEAIERWTQAPDPEPEDVEVYRANWEVLQVWLMLATQWRRDVFTGAWLGLDYAAIETVHRLAGYGSCTPTRFADLREMELTALPILNERR